MHLSSMGCADHDAHIDFTHVARVLLHSVDSVACCDETITLTPSFMIASVPFHT